MRVVASIRAGKVLPSTLLRKLGNYSRKNRLYRAFREIGRAVRTEFLLRFLSSQELRRQITAATNKAESYNGFSKWLLFGGDGIVPDLDPEDREKRLKFNQILADSLVLQNAADMTDALRSLAEEGYPLRREEVVQLSPYLTEHVKRFGDYVVDLEAGNMSSRRAGSYANAGRVTARVHQVRPPGVRIRRAPRDPVTGATRLEPPTRPG
jgi:hypothetical protein